jgi:hypothetical protein
VWNNPALNLDGWASAKNAPSSASSDAQTQHGAVSSGRLAAHVVVMGEPGGDRSRARLDPLHRVTEQSEAAVATAYPKYTGTLLPNPADVGDMMDLLSRSPDERERAVHRVRA